MSRETKRKGHGRQELVAIFRLEFYRKQTRWKLAHASARKTAPAARKGRVLNQTYTVDAEGCKHALEADSKMVSSSEEKENSSNYLLIPSEAFDTDTLSDNNELDRRQEYFSQDTYEEENISNSCVNEEDQEGRQQPINENLVSDIYQKEDKLKSLHEAIALHIYQEEVRNKHNLLRNSNIPALSDKHENLKLPNINNENKRPKQYISENNVLDIFEEQNTPKPINEGISSDMFQQVDRQNHKILLRNLNIAAEQLQHENLQQFFEHESAEKDTYDQNNNRPKQYLTDNAFPDLFEHKPKSQINEFTPNDFHQQQIGSKCNINLLRNFNEEAVSVKYEEKNNFKYYLESLKDFNVAKIITDSTVQGDIQEHYLLTPGVLNEATEQFQQEFRPRFYNDKVTVIDIEEQEHMPVINFNEQENVDVMIPHKYQQNTQKSYGNEGAVTDKYEENNNLKNYLNSIRNSNVANILTDRNEIENRQTFFTDTPADLNLVPDIFKKEMIPNTYVHKTIFSDIYEQENIPKSDSDLQENFNLMTPDRYQDFNNPKYHLNEVNENKLKNYLDTFRNSNETNRFELKSIPKSYINENATPDKYEQNGDTLVDSNTVKSNKNEENKLKNFLNMLRDSNMSTLTSEQKNKPERNINKVEMDLNKVSHRYQQDVQSNWPQSQERPQEAAWQMYSNLITRHGPQRCGPEVFTQGPSYSVDTQPSVPLGFDLSGLVPPARPAAPLAHGRRCECADCADERAYCTDDVQMQWSAGWSIEPEGSWGGEESLGAREFAAGAALRPHSSELQLHPAAPCPQHADSPHTRCTCGDVAAGPVTQLGAWCPLTSTSPSECHHLASRRVSPPTPDRDVIIAGSHLYHPQRGIEGGVGGMGGRETGRGRGRLQLAVGGAGRGRL